MFEFLQTKLSRLESDTADFGEDITKDFFSVGLGQHFVDSVNQAVTVLAGNTTEEIQWWIRHYKGRVQLHCPTLHFFEVACGKFQTIKSVKFSKLRSSCWCRWLSQQLMYLWCNSQWEYEKAQALYQDCCLERESWWRRPNVASVCWPENGNWRRDHTSPDAAAPTNSAVNYCHRKHSAFWPSQPLYLQPTKQNIPYFQKHTLYSILNCHN